MKKSMLLAGSLLLFVQSQMGYAGQNSECRMIDYLGNKAMICFPEGTICFDPHGIGDGVPVERDCWSAISRMCHPGVDRYPGCAGGTIANICKPVLTPSGEVQACFPVGHICYDPHGIGDGVPVPVDCWQGGSRMCHAGTSLWPECAGGHIKAEG